MGDMTRNSLFLLFGLSLMTSAMAQGKVQTGGPASGVPTTFPLRTVDHRDFKAG